MFEKLISHSNIVLLQFNLLISTISNTVFSSYSVTSRTTFQVTVCLWKENKASNLQILNESLKMHNSLLIKMSF